MESRRQPIPEQTDDQRGLRGRQQGRQGFGDRSLAGADLLHEQTDVAVRPLPGGESEAQPGEELRAEFRVRAGCGQEDADRWRGRTNRPGGARSREQ